MLLWVCGVFLSYVKKECIERGSNACNASPSIFYLMPEGGFFSHQLIEGDRLCNCGWIDSLDLHSYVIEAPGSSGRIYIPSEDRISRLSLTLLVT